jgi:hypothetical protein
MKKIAKLSTAFVAALAAASTLAWSGPGDGADTQWERASFYVDGFSAPVPCLGENVVFSGWVPYRRHEVTTPSGNTSYKYQLLPQTPNIVPFIGIGELSGDVYYYQNGHPFNESFHLAAGETLSVHTRELYESDEGVRFEGVFTLHMTTNANGELTVNRLESDGFECK